MRWCYYNEPPLYVAGLLRGYKHSLVFPHERHHGVLARDTPCLVFGVQFLLFAFLEPDADVSFACSKRQDWE